MRFPQKLELGIDCEVTRQRKPMLEEEIIDDWIGNILLGVFLCLSAGPAHETHNKVLQMIASRTPFPPHSSGTHFEAQLSLCKL